MRTALRQNTDVMVRKKYENKNNKKLYFNLFFLRTKSRKNINVKSR